MLLCRPDVTFLSMETLVWPYHYCDGNFVCLRHNTCVGAVLGFTSYTHRSYMKITQLHVTRTQNICKSSFMIYYICLKIIETQTGWQSNDVRRDHTIWPRVKMESIGQIQYRMIQQWIKLKINTKFWNGLYIPTHLCGESFESHVRLCSWNLIHSVGQNWWHAFSMDGKFAKGKLFPKVRPMNRVIYDLTFLQGKINLKELD